RLVLDFALAALRAEQLGKHDATDYLAVGFCSTDYIGHDYGPNSHEIREQFARLDRTLNDLITALEQQVGKDQFVVALSADHGVLQLPEYLAQEQNFASRRINPRKIIDPAIAKLDSSLQEEFDIAEDLIESRAFLNYRAAAAKGVDSLWLERLVRDGLLQIDGIADVYFRREISGNVVPQQPYLEQFRRNYYSPREGDFLLRYCENCLVSTRRKGTSHGTPYRYDTHVPVIFWGMNLKPQRVGRAIHTIDVAPTLAAILGIRYPRSVEGEVLKEITSTERRK
ncbi:MAG TPA: alkaline phosphatase family protein, partial [Bacteroidota bacterium]